MRRTAAYDVSRAGGDQTKAGQQGRAEKRQRIPPRLVASSACVFMLLRNSPGHVLYTGFCRFDFSPLARLFRFADAAPPFGRIEPVGDAPVKTSQEAGSLTLQRVGRESKSAFRRTLV